MQSFLVKHQITQVTQPPYSLDLAPCYFWLFPKLKLPLKWKRFQTINELQENTMGQLMAIKRTIWGLKVPTLKGTEASLSYVHCFLYFESSSVNVFFIVHGWIPSGQTSYIYMHITEKETIYSNIQLAYKHYTHVIRFSKCLVLILNNMGILCNLKIS